MKERKLSEIHPRQNSRRPLLLTLIKLSHTIIWAFFAGCIFALPLAGVKRRFDWALALTVAVLLECFIIVANRWRCPLTRLAAQFTEDRTDNFDIYLPIWMARHNKAIFGSLFLAGEIIVLGFWLKG
ncbi:MAG: hypothetical protein P4N24_19580 [Acidobacteriota bacterium]|nr:hypothetical protein [Acidobacteriota bacterium]